MPLLVFCVRCHWMQHQGARISMPQHLMVCQRAVSLSNPSGQQCSPSSSFPSPFWWFMSCMWCSCYDSRGTSPSRAEDSTSSCVVWLIFSFRCFFFTWDGSRKVWLWQKIWDLWREWFVEIALAELHQSWATDTWKHWRKISVLTLAWPDSGWKRGVASY